MIAVVPSLRLRLPLKQREFVVSTYGLLLMTTADRSKGRSVTKGPEPVVGDGMSPLLSEPTNTSY